MNGTDDGMFVPEGVDSGVEAECEVDNLVSYDYVEATRRFNEVYGKRYAGSETDEEMVFLTLEHHNLEQLVEQGDASSEVEDRYAELSEVLDAYMRMLVPDDERRAEIMAAAEADVDLEDMAKVVEDALSVARADAVVGREDNLIQFPGAE